MQKTKLMRAACAVFAVLFILCALPVTNARAKTVPSEREGSAYLYNIENERAVYEKEADVKRFPAASVKLMTAALAYEKLSGRMDEKITVTSEMLSGVAGNRFGFRAGDEVTVEDLFYVLVLKGANDAAAILAYLAAGSEGLFVDMMNDRAAQLSMNDTVYRNVTGMHHPDMVTTVSDTAKAGRLFASYKTLLDMSCMSHRTVDGADVYNRNAFVTKLNSMWTKEYYYSEAKGMSYGMTDEGGESFVSIAERAGLSYICVILGARTPEASEDGTTPKVSSFVWAKELFDYALGGFGYIKVLSIDRLVYDMPVRLCELTDHVMLVPEGEIYAYLALDTNIEREISYTYTLDTESLTAPVEAGARVGVLYVYRGEELLGEVGLVTQNGAELSVFLSSLEKIKSFTKSKFFICTLIALVLVTVGFVIVSGVRRAKKAKKRTVYRFR